MGEVLTVCGLINVIVTYQKQVCHSLQFVEFDGPTIMIRDWLGHLVLDSKHLHVHSTDISGLIGSTGGSCSGVNDIT